jgi:hypothetical protein
MAAVTIITRDRFPAQGSPHIAILVILLYNHDLRTILPKVDFMTARQTPVRSKFSRHSAAGVPARHPNFRCRATPETMLKSMMYKQLLPKTRAFRAPFPVSP